MRSIRVLIVYRDLRARGGVQLHIRDLSVGLLKRGHQPVVYTPESGDLARELRAQTIPVVSDLDQIGAPPDVIHGHSSLETVAALELFADAPAIFVCHGWVDWPAAPPRIPRIRRYVAVDETTRDRMLLQEGIPESKIAMAMNAVDLTRFQPRPPLPLKPRRALVFSNLANELTHLSLVREACLHEGIELDVLGWTAANEVDQPETILGSYDLVFAKAKCAIEALAVGCSVVLCDAMGMGPLVTRAEVERLRRQNFGLRALDRPVSRESLLSEIRRYDPADAAKVSAYVREVAGVDLVIEELVSMYEAVIAEHRATPVDRTEERRAMAEYLAWLSRQMQSPRGGESIVPVFRMANRVLRVPLIGRSIRWIAKTFGGPSRFDPAKE